ncbi:MAG: tetratricopeptide repeat protein [Planctomycetota bacterium]
MIIYGSRMYFKEDTVRSFSECEHCGTYGPKISYKAKKFGHIYFIPLIPMGARSQILRECKACDMGIHMPVAEMEPRIAELGEQFKNWIMEVQQGNNTVEPAPGEDPLNVGLLISGILNDMYCLKEIEGIEHIAKILLDQNMQYEHDLVAGHWFEIVGDLNRAATSFESAHKVNPDDSIPLFLLGRACIRQGNAAGAEAALQKYIELEPDDVQPWIELATLYEGKSDFPNIVRTYDQIFTMLPDTLSNRGMKKIYKKACKKSGQQGKFLDKI